MRISVRVSFRGLAWLLTAALSFACARGDEVPRDPAEPGPYAVGVRTIVFEDPSRAGLEDGKPRRLVTEVWYPATEAARGKAGATYDIRTYLTEKQNEDTADADIPLLETWAVRDAKPRRDAGPYPLVVFSHGMGALRWQSTFFTVMLASHGYIVVSPDHEGGTLAELLRGVEPNVFDYFEVRPADVSVLLDRMLDLPSSDPLAGLADAERIGVTGHSLGAMTALRSAVADDRVRAIVPHAPADARLTTITPDIPVSVMLLGGRQDIVLPWAGNIEPSWNALPAPRILLGLDRGGHYTFSVLCQFDLASIAAGIELDIEAIEGIDIEEILQDGCGDDNIPAEAAQRLINHFSIGFFNATLRNDGSWDLLTQEHADAIAPDEAEVRIALEAD